MILSQPMVRFMLDSMGIRKTTLCCFVLAGNSPAIIQDKDDTELLESLLMDIDGPPLMVEPIPEIQTASVVPIKQEHEDIISQPLASEKPVAAGETKPQKRALGKDDEAKLLKKQRRLVRNRMSAQVIQAS